MTTTTGPGALASTFRFNTQAIPAFLDGLDGDLLTDPVGQGRCALWQLGHIVTSRRFVGRQAGMEIPLAPWEEMFSPQADATPREDWPDKSALLADLAETGTRVAEAVADLSDEQAGRPVRSLFDPDSQEPLAHQLSFLLFHEGYHIGQIGYIRSVHGLPYLA